MWRNGAATKSKNMTWESSNGDFPHAHTAAVIFSSRSAAKPPPVHPGGFAQKNSQRSDNNTCPLCRKNCRGAPTPFLPRFADAEHGIAFHFHCRFFLLKRFLIPMLPHRGGKIRTVFALSRRLLPKRKQPCRQPTLYPIMAPLCKGSWRQSRLRDCPFGFPFIKNPPDSADRFSQRHRYFGKIKIPDR